MELSRYAQRELLDHVLSVGLAFPQPLNLFLSLHQGSPFPVNEATAANEVTGAGYARQPISFDASTNATPAVCLQAAAGGDIAFTATANWVGGDITHVAIWDAVSGGNPLVYAAMTTPRTMNNGDTMTFPAGSGMNVSMD